MVKIHGRDRSFEGTEEKMSDHPCCRINRGRINRVALYIQFKHSKVWKLNFRPRCFNIGNAGKLIFGTNDIFI